MTGLLPIEIAVLQNIRARDGLSLNDVDGQHRERVIELGMRDPPLLDVDGDDLSLTDAGNAYLDGLVPIPCEACGGEGYVVDQGCCGNFGRTGECLGHCSIPIQAQCSLCSGGVVGFVEPEGTADE